MLEDEHIASFLAMEEVHAAKQQIDARTSGSVYFTVGMTDAIKAVLKDTFDLDLLDTTSVPMRWIKGDITPHVDVGTAAFDTTHLLYLTDNPGELVVDGTSYPITKGAAYTFPESCRHETINTGSEPRLLLGPMSEEGFAVGVPTTNIITGAGNTFVYIRQMEGSLEYSYDQTSWYLFTTPTTIINTDTGVGILTVDFVSDFEFTSINDYFICGSTNIQFGSASLKIDGSRPIITINGVTNYPGLIQNGTSGANGYSNIYVYNLVVAGTGGTTLFDGGGWISQEFFGRAVTDNYIVNCSSDGVISTSGGGIIGQYAGSGTGANLTITGCSSSGSIGQDAGGITGIYVGNGDGNVTCNSCWSTGNIDVNGGGIVGIRASIATITNCYSTGTISSDAGGICGTFCGNAGFGSNILITNCYSTGRISGLNSGGIVGSASGFVTIQNCYSLGSTEWSSSGGIIGFTKISVYTIANCYTAGTVTGGQGYIIGASGVIPSTCFSEAFANAPGGVWSSMNANTVLQGLPAPVVGNIWVSTVLNQPYELFSMGYTPYDIANIIPTAVPTLHRSVAASITAGTSTAAAIISGRSYTVLQIVGTNPEPYSSITMDPTTGVISTTGSTVPGTYAIYLRNTGSYNITVYTLTITEAAGGLSCCDRPTFKLGPGVGYEVYTDLIAGNIMMENLQRKNLSYDQLMTIRKAQASKK